MRHPYYAAPRLHGGDEFEGVLNKLESQGQSLIDPKGYNVNYGSSYMQVVTFDERGPVAQGLLTYGQSSDLASPRAYDQLPLFAATQHGAIFFFATTFFATTALLTLAATCIFFRRRRRRQRGAWRTEAF